MATTYTVKKGDTLWAISRANNTTVNALVALNNITDPDYIVVGQVIKLSGTADSVKKNTTSTATIKVFGLQSNTDRTVYATWTWDKSNTQNYQVKWYYDTGDGVWFVGNDSTVTEKQSTYNAPTNATRVKFTVKPISKTRKVNNKETSYWTASWSTAKTYSFSSNPPSVPPVPTVKMDGLKLTASLDNLDVNASIVQFQVVKDDVTVCNTAKVAIKTSSASYSCTVAAGSNYKVRARANRDNLYSDWSNYSSNVGTIPATPSKITKCVADSERKTVTLEWPVVKNTTSYEVQYTTNKSYFDSSDVSPTSVTVTTNTCTITSIENGSSYFFRVRAKNSNGDSGWSEISSATVGTGPAAPTTWSSTNTVTLGESVTLYWVHNSEDGSKQTYAHLEVYIDDVKDIDEKISYPDTDTTNTGSFTIETANASVYAEGAQIRWRVRTAGVTNEYGDFSTPRAIDIYAPPTLELNAIDSEGNNIETLSQFPIYISAIAGPGTQTPINYHLSVISNSAYDTVDSIGNVKTVSVGEEIYAKHFDISDALSTELSANDVDLENNASYTIKCVVAMNSGLTAEASIEDILVAWTDEQYEPNAEILFDEETYSTSIRPYCEDEEAILIPGISLSVYRREFDGSFTEIATDIDNESNTFVSDPHPALDYARYRVVAKTVSTGAVSYCDISAYPIGCKAAIIQWNEAWSNFSTTNEDSLEQPAWSGSLLKLPYNIDISDKHKTDVELIEYIGRKHPVTYYGSQLGESSTWNMEVPKDDVETLYALRRLARWTGDVYVREPSGSGYWANVTVSFSQKHCEVTIPITLDVVRVEGGV